MNKLSRFLLLITLVLLGCHKETPLPNNGNNNSPNNGDQFVKIYNPVELDQLRAFLRQLSRYDQTTKDANLERLGLSPVDTINWTTDEKWVSKVTSIYWNTDIPKRLIKIYWDGKDIKGNLNLSNFSALTDLYCRETWITSLNVSGCAALQYLHCWTYESLKFPNVSTCASLIELSFLGNQWHPSVDVAKNTALKYLDLHGNMVKSIDVSKNTALTKLILGYNDLASLDVSKCTVLEYLDVSFNTFSGTALNNLFNTLHSKTVSGVKRIDVSENSYSNLDTTIATSKGWKVFQ